MNAASLLPIALTALSIGWLAWGQGRRR
jgi:hypothetical protein